MTVERVGVSFEPELLAQFDELIHEKGYTNRSEALRDLARKAIVDSALEHPDAIVYGGILILYSHGQSSLLKKLVSSQHKHHHNIISSTHVHVDEEKCLELLVVMGKMKEVKGLADAIGSIKGVKDSRLSVTIIKPKVIARKNHSH